MTRNRITAACVLLGVAAPAVTFLTAARDPAKADPAAAAPSQGDGRKLVCNGTADVQDGIVPLFPENFPSPAKVVEVKVKEGQAVKKGDPLLVCDDELAKSAVAEAEAALKMAKGERAKAEAAVAGQDYLFKQQQQAWMAKTDELKGYRVKLKRAKEKAAQPGLATGDDAADVEFYSRQVEGAEKGVEAERIKMEAAEKLKPTFGQDISAALEQKQKVLLDRAKYALDLLTLKAPEDGKILRSLATPGLTFGPQTRQPAFWFQPKGELLVRAEVQQEFAARIAVGQAATVSDESDDAASWKGKVTHVGDCYLPKRSSASQEAFMPFNDERVLECLIKVDVPKDGKPLRIGQKVRVTINGDK